MNLTKITYLALPLLVTSVRTQTIISIDNEEELKAVEGTTESTCSGLMYSDSHADLCKENTVDPGTSGFWSSCSNTRCDISISVGKLGGLGKVPNSISVLSYVQGDAEIVIRYRATPGGPVMSVIGADPISNSNWESLPFDISQVILTPDSEIVLRLYSAPTGIDVAGPTGIDVVDKIIFTFSETTTEPPVPTSDTTTSCQIITTPAYTPTFPTTTTIGPGFPDLVLDTDADLTEGWININCAYESDPRGFTECPFNIDPENSVGFWSSCGQSSCTLMFALGRYINPLSPSSITLTSYVRGSSKVEIKVRVGNSIPDIGTISNTVGWTNTSFDLTHAELNNQSIIYLESTSSSTVTNIDLIDKVYISFD